MIGKFLVLLTFLVSQSIFAQSTWNNLQISNQQEIGGIFQSIESNYGPLLYKENYFSPSVFSWNTAKPKYANILSKASSTLEFYEGIANLFSELRDSHVSVTFPSNYTKVIDLEFSMVGRTTFVSYAGSSVMRYCQVLVGDKLVKFNGQSPTAWRNALGKFRTTGNKKTDARYLTMSFTKYQEARGVPRSFYAGDTAEFVLDRMGRKFTCSIPWTVAGYPLENRFSPMSAMEKVAYRDQFKSALFKDDFVAPSSWRQVKNELRSASRIASQFHNLVDTHAYEKQEEFLPARTQGVGKKTEIGGALPFFKLPNNFKPLALHPMMKEIVAQTGLYAGTFSRNGKVFGLLRIPSYVPKDLILSLFALRYVVATLEQNTDALIIDQSSNPGGYVAYSDWIIASLVPQLDQRRHMQFKVKPTSGFMRNFGQILSEIQQIGAANKNNSAIQKIVEVYEPAFKEAYARVYAAYQAQAFESEPVNLSIISYFIEDFYSVLISEQMGNPMNPLALVGSQTGIDLTKRQKYTKPKYMIINELCFSGGDATPANLQDYGAVTIVGVNTAGAGGSVGSFSSSSKNPFSYRLTESLMFRPAQVGPYKYVENIGVRPDIKVDLNLSDYQNGFRNYFDRVLAALRL